MGRGLDPGGGTGGVRPGGRGDRRRSGGNADHAARRSRRRLTREPTASTGGDRWSAGEHPAPGRRERSARRMAGRTPQPRTAAGAEVFRGIEGGRQHPSPAATLNVACAGLPTITVESQPSAEPPKTPLGRRSRAASTGSSRASSPASRSPVSLAARATGDPRHLPGDSGGSLPTAVFPLPLPLGNPRSSI